MCQVAIQLRQKLRVLEVTLIGGGKFLQGKHEGFRHKLATIGTEVPVFIRKRCAGRAGFNRLCLRHCLLLLS